MTVPLPDANKTTLTSTETPLSSSTEKTFLNETTVPLSNANKTTLFQKMSKIPHATMEFGGGVLIGTGKTISSTIRGTYQLIRHPIDTTSNGIEHLTQTAGSCKKPTTFHTFILLDILSLTHHFFFLSFL